MLNEDTYQIIGAAMRVHTELGPGFREQVYEAALVADLRTRGRDIKQQIAIPFTIGGRRIGKAARVDVIVDDTIILEVKAARAIGPHDIKQVLTYLKLLDLKLGLILNFAAPSMREGIRRVINSPAP